MAYHDTGHHHLERIRRCKRRRAADKVTIPLFRGEAEANGYSQELLAPKLARSRPGIATDNGVRLSLRLVAYSALRLSMIPVSRRSHGRAEAKVASCRLQIRFSVFQKRRAPLVRFQQALHNQLSDHDCDHVAFRNPARLSRPCLDPSCDLGLPTEMGG